MSGKTKQNKKHNLLSKLKTRLYWELSMVDIVFTDSLSTKSIWMKVWIIVKHEVTFKRWCSNIVVVIVVRWEVYWVEIVLVIGVVFLYNEEEGWGRG